MRFARSCRGRVTSSLGLVGSGVTGMDAVPLSWVHKGRWSQQRVGSNDHLAVIGVVGTADGSLHHYAT